MFSLLRSRVPESDGRRVDPWVFFASGGLLAAFVIAALVAPGPVGAAIDAAFAWSARWFGAYWQLMMLATFVIAGVLAFSRYGRVRMGGRDAPEYGNFKWVSMVMCTLLGAGGVFWAAAEPIAHYADRPPLFGEDVDPVSAALAQAFTDWGFLGWAIGGSLATLVMLRGAQKGMPMRPRTLLWPVMGERVKDHWVGTVVDICCAVAVVAGTVGPVGFLGLQVSYIAGQMFGIPDTYATQVIIIGVLTMVAGASVLIGLDKGIQNLSRANIWLALVMLSAVLALGSPAFVGTAFMDAFSLHIAEFVPMNLYRGDEAWLGYWTVFFFGWFLGYAPMMAIFIARISRGRTVRQIFVGATVVPSILSMVWFTVLGGTGIWIEQQNPGAVSAPYAEHGLPSAALSIVQQLPMSGALAFLVAILTIVFVATNVDSMSYALAAAGTLRGEPRRFDRGFWCLLMGAAAVALIAVGEDGVSALQSFIVVTAVPVGFIMLPTLWTTPRLIKEMAVEQGLAKGGPPPADAAPAERTEVPAAS